MTPITPANAIEAVRKNLDEQGLNESVMYNDENADNDSMDSIIAKTLPEAINEIHRIAPVYLLEGDSLIERNDNQESESSSSSQSESSNFSQQDVSISGRVLLFSVPDTCLRLAAFQAADSDIVVTDVIPEASAEGRKQLNPYIRGTYDNPRMVKVQGKGGPMSFRYYSLKDSSFDNHPIDAISRLEVIYQAVYNDQAGASYQASTELVDSIMYQLTAMVLAIYGQAEMANYFTQKALKWKTS